MTAPTTSTAPSSVIAKVKTAAQSFWALVIQFLAGLALDALGVDVTELSAETVTALVAFTHPIVVAALMWAVDKLSGPFPIVKRLWIFVTDPVY